MPSRSSANWAGVNATLPSFAEGQTNRPFSNRLENRQAPPLTVPPNDLDQIATPSTENEHVAAIRVLLQRLFRLSRQRRKPPAHTDSIRPPLSGLFCVALRRS